MNSPLPPATPTPTILLTPRPLAKAGGKLTLVPLFAPPPESDISRLPVEIWARVLEYTFTPSKPSRGEAVWRKSLLRICKAFKQLVEPLFYAYPPLHSVHSFVFLKAHLNKCDQQPIALHRIPYSAPGRWIQILDLTYIPVSRPADRIAIDQALGAVFSFTPLLTTLMLDPSCRPSRMTLESLTEAECAKTLTALTGLSPPLAYLVCRDNSQIRTDPIIALLLRTTNLERLGLYFLPANDEYLFEEPSDTYHAPENLLTDHLSTAPSLHLPKLTHLSIKNIFTTPCILSLTNSLLPTLQSLTVTRHDHLSIPQDACTFLPSLLRAHALSLKSLHFFPTPPYMHVRQSQGEGMPDHVLREFPNLTFLSLSHCGGEILPPVGRSHPLRCLAIPKPIGWLLPKIEKLLSFSINPHSIHLDGSSPNQNSYQNGTLSGLVSPADTQSSFQFPKQAQIQKSMVLALPAFKILMFTDRQWLPSSVHPRARESGVHGEMLIWKRRLRARGVVVLDSLGREEAA